MSRYFIFLSALLYLFCHSTVQEAFAADILLETTRYNTSFSASLEQEGITSQEPAFQALAQDTRWISLINTWQKRQTKLWETLPQETFVINASAYTSAADECGKSDGITASGVKVLEKRTLACPPRYPFGAIVEIEGMGQYVCEDRGGAIKGNKFDIYMKTKKEAFAFGRRNLEAKFIIP